MFITVDGPDGTGKTTAARSLVRALTKELGRPAVFTSEPTDSALGREIRRILRAGGAEFNSLTELFVQDRGEHIRDYIQPHLEQGDIVVCDRYRYSTVCYQHLQGVEIQRLVELNQGFPAPDIAFILYADNADVLLARIGARGGEKDIFESRELLQRGIGLYKNMKQYYPEDNIVYIRADREPEAVLRDMLASVISIT